MNSAAVIFEIKRYESGIQLLKDSIKDVLPEQMTLHPIPEKWSIAECIFHISDMESVFADRMKRIIAMDNPALISADENRYASELAYNKRDVKEEILLFTLTRNQMLRILNSIPEPSFLRTGVHSEAGTLSLFQVLKKSCSHLEHHLWHMNEKRMNYGLSLLPIQPSSD